MDADPWETGLITTGVESEISDLSLEEAPQVLINEENVVMVDLEVSQGVISSMDPENGTTCEEPMFFYAEENPWADMNSEMIPQESYLETEVEETGMKELETSLEPLSTTELNYDSEEPTIVSPPSPMLTSTSKEQVPLCSYEENEMLSSLDEEMEVAALLLNDYSKEKEKEHEEKSTDLDDDES